MTNEATWNSDFQKEVYLSVCDKGVVFLGLFPDYHWDCL